MPTTKINQPREPEGLDLSDRLEKSELGGVQENIKHDSSKETEGLRKAADAIPSAAWLVMLLTMAERFSFYGMTAPFMNFMQNNRDDVLRPGALGWGQARASQVSNAFYVMALLTPIASGLVADKRLGRYKVLCITFSIYLTGSALLLLSSIPVLASRSAGLFITALVFIAVGMSGANGLLAAFVGDQYTTEDGTVVTTRSGERIVVDRARTIESIYNAYYWCINVGGLSGLATTALELHVGFWAAFLLPLCALSLSAAVLILGRGRMTISPAQPSAIPNALRAMWLAVCAGFSLDKARPAHQQVEHARKVAWTDVFVDELQTALEACRILFATWPVLWLCRGQINNNLVSQAAQMDTAGVPNDMMYNANPIIIILFMPVVDKVLFPWLRRSGYSLTAVTRLTWGFALEALAMAMAAVVQKLIYISPPCYESPMRCTASYGGAVPNAISVFVQVPIYVLEALSEILSSPAGYEKSVMQSVFSATGAVAAGLSIAISPMYKDPDMVWVYASLAVLMGAVTTVFYLIWARKLG
ncbi:oligopeptide transporter [Colletotrichum tofieldiae]|nr:Oligopeptide transporter [Colletotrichum tofieldiae]GKT81667.1 oligopeptide transporter [Colletotrichum tofieldiae]